MEPEMAAKQMGPEVVWSGGSRLSWKRDLPFQVEKFHTAQQFSEVFNYIIYLFRKWSIFKSSFENLHSLDTDEFSIALCFPCEAVRVVWESGESSGSFLTVPAVGIVDIGLPYEICSLSVAITHIWYIVLSVAAPSTVSVSCIVSATCWLICIFFRSP